MAIWIRIGPAIKPQVTTHEETCQCVSCGKNIKVMRYGASTPDVTCLTCLGNPPSPAMTFDIRCAYTLETDGNFSQHTHQEIITGGGVQHATLVFLDKLAEICNGTIVNTNLSCKLMAIWRE